MFPAGLFEASRRHTTILEAYETGGKALYGDKCGSADGTFRDTAQARRGSRSRRLENLKPRRDWRDPSKRCVRRFLVAALHAPVRYQIIQDVRVLKCPPGDNDGRFECRGRDGAQPVRV